MKNFVVIFVTLIFFAFTDYYAIAATANISGLVFTTEPISVAPGELSSGLTIQTQNALGGAEQVDETNDITFTSSSASGQFLNSSGNAVSTTMSKNTASRTFYYKDDALGTHTLTVSITGRTSSSTFSASQEIIVGTTSGGTNSTSTQATTTSSTSTSVGSSNTKGVISSHSEQEEVTSASPTVSLKVGVGRERIVTVFTPLELHAITSSLPANTTPLYFWSYGDGSTGSGEQTSHWYNFAGDYNVVLSASLGEMRAVARTKVRVVEPDVKIVNAMIGNEGFVEIRNDSSYEVNLEGWHILSDNSRFIFPKNTIINPRSSLKFPLTAFATASGKVFLTYPNQSEVAHYSLISQPNVVTVQDNALEMEARVSAANARLEVWRKEWIASHTPSTTATSTSNVSKADQTNVLIDTVKTEQKSSMSSILDAPAHILRFINGIFAR